MARNHDEARACQYTLKIQSVLHHSDLNGVKGEKKKKRRKKIVILRVVIDFNVNSFMHYYTVLLVSE